MRPGVALPAAALVAASSCVVIAALAGCGSSRSQSADAGPVSTGNGYEAFPPDFPSIVSSGGSVLTAPRIVTVTWDTDDAGATLQAFDEALGGSAYWKTVTSEYGVGAAHNVNVVEHTAPPATWDDTAIDAWVKSQAQSSSSGWPSPDGQTAYIVYLPASVQITSSGMPACGSYAGYHTDLQASPEIVYALVPEGCYAGSGYSLLDNATSSGAHELVECAVDPFTNQNPAYIGFDGDHLAWELWMQWQDEVADACEFTNYTYYKETGALPYEVARIWSNASAQAGRDPCVPRLSGAYFDVAPQGLEDLSVQAVGYDGVTVQPFSSKGWRIGVGQSRTVKVGFFSDAPKGTWAVQVTEGDCCSTPAGLLDIQPTTLNGKNGTVGEVTITVKKAPPQGTSIPIAFTSSDNMIEHVRPALVGVY